MTTSAAAGRPVRVELWAPDADVAEAVVGAARRPMRRTGAETFAIDLPDGTDYLLSIDGAKPRPDPRSRWQPHDVHDASRTFDLAAHAWTDGAWAGVDPLGTVFYELHVGTFTPAGTLDAAIERLPDLRDVGVDIVELMPVAAFPGRRGWGYDGVALYAVHDAYGGPAALQRFVNAAHRLGLGVCLDVVYNHFGPAGNYATTFAPYLTRRHQTPWGDAINLDDTSAAGVRAFLVGNALQWVRDFHVDALRLDAVHALMDDSDRHILAEIADAVHAFAAEAGRPASVVAESDLNDTRMVTPTDQGGYGMDAQWNDDVHHALHSYLTGETFGYYVDFGSPETLATALTEVFVHAGGHSTFRGKAWGAPVPDTVDRRRFVVFTQNHDQVGNRALGDRPDANLAPGAVACGSAVLLLGPFTPLLFQGQEWGSRRPFLYFTDHDEELGRLVREGRTAEFAGHGWEELYGHGLDVPDPQDLGTFSASRLDWAERDQPGPSHVLSWHRDLIALRRELLRGGGHPVRVDVGEGWLRMVHGPVTVILSPGPGDVEVPEERSDIAASFGAATVAGSVVRLGPESVVVLRG